MVARRARAPAGPRVTARCRRMWSAVGLRCDRDAGHAGRCAWRGNELRHHGEPDGELVGVDAEDLAPDDPARRANIEDDGNDPRG